MTDIIQGPTRASGAKLVDCGNLRQAFMSAEFMQRIESMIPRHMSAERLFRMFQQAAAKQPEIYDVDVRQACGQFFALANLGLEPNTPLNHAYLIPFKDKVWNPATRSRDIDVTVLNTVIGYPGYAELLWRTGTVTGIHADVVSDHDDFEYWYGTNAELKHRKARDGSSIGRGGAKPIFAYAHVDLDGGKGQAFEVMTWGEVLDIRNESQAYQGALSAKEEGDKRGYVPKKWTAAPWVKNESEMAKKTPFRRLVKWLRKSPELAAAVDLEETQERGARVDFSPIIEGTGSFADGLPELEDGRTIDNTAAFGDRRERETVQQQGQRQETQGQRQETQGQQQQQKPKEQPRQQSQQQTRQNEPPDDSRWGGEPQTQRQTNAAENIARNIPEQSQPEFEVQLCDVYGDPNPDDPFRNAVDYARALVSYFLACAAEQKESCLEANADGIEILRGSTVPEIVRLMQQLVIEAEVPVDPWEVKMPLNAAGKPFVNGYVAAVRTSLATVTRTTPPGGIKQWLAANVPTIEGLTSAARAAVNAAVTERATTLGLSTITYEPMMPEPESKASVESTAGEEPGAAEAPPDDPNRVRAEQIATEFDQAETLAALKLIPKATATARFLAMIKAERPDLAEILNARYLQREAALKGAKP